MKIDKDWVIIGILFCVIAFLSVKIYTMNKQSKITIEQIHKQDDTTGRYTVIYHDQTIASLKKTNRDLYDSLQVYRDKVEYLLKFKYEKGYTTDTVRIDTTTDNEKVEVFEYQNAKNDTLMYNLQIGSLTKPKWYKLDLKLSNEFTIINKKDGDINETNIIPSHNGNISDVTVFKKKKNNFFKNFVIGPSINFGYDVINKQFGVNVGISATYKIN